MVFIPKMILFSDKKNNVVCCSERIRHMKKNFGKFFPNLLIFPRKFLHLFINVGTQYKFEFNF